MSEDPKRYGPTGHEQLHHLTELCQKAEAEKGLTPVETVRFMGLVAEALAILLDRLDWLEADRRVVVSSEMPQNSLDSTARDRLLTLLARLGSRLDNPPDPPESIRSLLQEAYDQGLDPKELYRVSTSSRPKWWPPAPSWDEVKPD